MEATSTACSRVVCWGRGAAERGSSDTLGGHRWQPIRRSVYPAIPFTCQYLRALADTEVPNALACNHAGGGGWGVAECSVVGEESGGFMRDAGFVCDK